MGLEGLTSERIGCLMTGGLADCKACELNNVGGLVGFSYEGCRAWGLKSCEGWRASKLKGGRA